MNSKLTPEQQKVADRWERERAIRLEAIDDMEMAEANNDVEALKKAMKKYAGSCGPHMCEHERHWSSNCSECEEIDMILHPELYKDGEPIDDFDDDDNDEDEEK